MNATQRRAGATADSPKRRLNVEVFDAWAARKGATTHDQRADLVRVDRATFIRWRSGQTSPSLDTALRIAALVRVPVDKLWSLDEQDVSS